jgi:hypothetical protein
MGVGTCLHAGNASALDFTFSFEGDGFPITTTSTVTGLISGLLDNTMNQTSGVTVSITSSTNFVSGYPLPVFTSSNLLSGTGLNVSNGVITGVGVYYGQNYEGNKSHQFVLDTLSLNYVMFTDGAGGAYSNGEVPATVGNLVFIPYSPSTASTPSPLPLFGAAAGFSFSRRLRRRIQVAASGDQG